MSAKSWLVKGFAVALPCGLGAAVVYGAGRPPADPPPPAVAPAPPTTSKSAVRNTEIDFIDPLTGSQVTVFESVATPTDPARYYYSPTLRPLPFDESGRKYDEVPVAGGTVVSLRVQYSHPGLPDQARRAMARAVQNVAGAPSPMRLSGLSFTCPNAPYAAVAPLGEPGAGRLNLGETGLIAVTVPADRVAEFKRLIDSKTGLILDARVYHESLGLQRASVGVSADDLKGTDQYRAADQGGAEYVTAAGVRAMYQQALGADKLRRYQDNPWIGAELDRASATFFAQLAGKMGERHIRSVEEAAALNKVVMEGLGLDPKAYQPIVLMYKYLDVLGDTTDHKRANQLAREVVTNGGIKGGLNVGIDLDFVKIGVDWGGHWSNMGKEMFKSDDELRRFRQTYHRKEGDGALVLGRGLKLVDRATFTANIGLAVSGELVVPVEQAATLTVRMTTADARPLAGVKLTEEKTAAEARLKAAEGEFAAAVGKARALVGEAAAIREGQAQLHKELVVFAEQTYARLGAAALIDQNKHVEPPVPDWFRKEVDRGRTETPELKVKRAAVDQKLADGGLKAAAGDKALTTSLAEVEAAAKKVSAARDEVQRLDPLVRGLPLAR
ncbi:MAG: hypothetical protein K2X87_18415 [Gemmataceae bacterium]|nr:hypothetical protein [Gemmataceae bacterium]